jgi:hypothetical protein
MEPRLPAQAQAQAQAPAGRAAAGAGPSVLRTEFCSPPGLRQRQAYCTLHVRDLARGRDEPRYRLDAKNFAKFFRFPVTLNLWMYVWSIKYR